MLRHIGLAAVSFGLAAMLAGDSGAEPRSGGFRSKLISPALRAQEQRLATSRTLGNAGRLGLFLADRLLHSGDLRYKKGSVNLDPTVGNRGRVVFVAAAPSDGSAPATNLGVVDISSRGKVRLHLFDQRDAGFLRGAVAAALDSAQRSGLVNGQKKMAGASPTIRENDVPKLWGGQLIGWRSAFYPSRSRSIWRPASE